VQWQTSLRTEESRRSTRSSTAATPSPSSSPASLRSLRLLTFSSTISPTTKPMRSTLLSTRDGDCCRYRSLQRITSAAGNSSSPSQTVAEMRFGALVAGWGESRLAELERRIALARVAVIDDAMIWSHARLRADCRAAGHALAQPSRPSDLWVAVRAFRHPARHARPGVSRGSSPQRHQRVIAHRSGMSGCRVCVSAVRVPVSGQRRRGSYG
jgi:predicted nucleic acid-binding protein